MIQAQDAEASVIYRPTRTGLAQTFYVLAPPRAAKALVKRLSKKGVQLRADEQVELASARDALAGRAVLFVRHMRGIDPMTGERWELRSYRALPLDYKLRAVKRKPGFA